MWIFQFCRILLQCFYLLVCLLSEEPLNHVVTVSGFQKSVWEFVETPLKAWTLGSFLSTLTPSALLSSAYLNTETLFFPLFFIIVASVESVAVLSSGRFERVWTNDLSSFVMCLKGMEYKCLLQRGTADVECSFLIYLRFSGGISKQICLFIQKDFKTLQTIEIFSL